jgi:hypothetical protein
MNILCLLLSRFYCIPHQLKYLPKLVIIFFQNPKYAFFDFQKGWGSLDEYENQ